MELFCPRCSRPLPAADVNVAANVAFCRPCNQAFVLSELVGAAPPSSSSPGPAAAAALDSALALPPAGVAFQETARGFTLRATTRSPMAFFLVPFACVWSGMSLGGIYGTQIARGQFIWPMSLFGLPFLAGSVFLLGFTLMTIAGHVEVNVEDGQGEVFTGVGPLGRRQRFRWDEISTVIEGVSSYGSRGQRTMQIQLDGPARRVSFGGMLSEGRRFFTLQALRRMLARRRS